MAASCATHDSKARAGVAAAEFRIPPVVLGYLDHSPVNCCFHETVIRAKHQSDQKGF